MNDGRRILVLGGGIGHLPSMGMMAGLLEREVGNAPGNLHHELFLANRPPMVEPELSESEDLEKYQSPQQQARWIWFLQKEDLLMAIFCYQQNLLADSSRNGRQLAKAAFKRATRGNRFCRITRLHQYAVVVFTEDQHDEIRNTAEMHYFCACHGLET